jgi:hypothetical protein
MCSLAPKDANHELHQGGGGKGAPAASCFEKLVGTFGEVNDGAPMPLLKRKNNPNALGVPRLLSSDWGMHWMSVDDGCGRYLGEYYYTPWASGISFSLFADWEAGGLCITSAFAR